MNKTTRFSLTLLAALATAQASAASTVKIATLSPLSGSSSNMGVQVKNGAQLAVNEMKAEFAKAGMTLSLVAYDDQADPATGTAAARRMAADRSILGMVGTVNSGVVLPVSQALAPSHLAIVSPLNVNEQVTDRGLKNVSRICARNDDQGPAAGNFVAGTLKAKKVYVLNDKTAYGQALADEAAKTMQAAGVKIVQNEGVAESERDFSAIITKIQTLKPDAIYFGAMYGQAAAFAQQLRARGIKTPIVGGDGYDSEDLEKLAGKGADNLYFTTVAPPLNAVPGAKAVAASYKKAFGSDLQGFGIMSYDATKVLLRGILNAAKANGNKAPTRIQVEQAVRGGTYKGLITGDVKFNAKGDRTSARLYMIAVKGGKRSTALTMTISRK